MRCPRNILLAKVMVTDEAALLDYLRYRSGVHIWVPWAFGVTLLVRTVAAIAIPAYQDYANRNRLVDYSGAAIAMPENTPSNTQTTTESAQP